MQKCSNNKIWQFQEGSPCETHELPQGQVQGASSGLGQSSVNTGWRMNTTKRSQKDYLKLILQICSVTFHAHIVSLQGCLYNGKRSSRCAWIVICKDFLIRSVHLVPGKMSCESGIMSDISIRKLEDMTMNMKLQGKKSIKIFAEKH